MTACPNHNPTHDESTDAHIKAGVVVGDKYCPKCKETKPLTLYYKGTSKQGVKSWCKACMVKTASAVNAAKVENPETREAALARKRKYTQTYRTKNPDQPKKYRALNKDNILEYNRLYLARRKKDDPIFKLSMQVRRLVSNAHTKKGVKKASKSESIMGLRQREMALYLINTAIDRYGVWLDGEAYEVDHIVPMHTARTEEDVLRLNHYTNLQLLTKADNRSKQGKLNWVG